MIFIESLSKTGLKLEGEVCMDLTKLDKWINLIEVKTVKNDDVEVVNDSPLKMIGKGRQGAVFKVDKNLCVKVFGKAKDCENEYYALSLGQTSKIVPQVFTKGPKYIAMELVKGVNLREYLLTQDLTMALTVKLINMLITFKEIGFTRIDHHKRHIYIQADGNLKVIDVGKSVGGNRFYPYPCKLLSSLGEKNKDIFLSHVKIVEPQLYNEWMHYIRVEELSREIYQLLMKQSGETDINKTISKKLLTIKDEKKHLSLLRQLIEEVFEEEWIKVMLARGYKPEEVMGEIKDYIDSLESQKHTYHGDQQNHHYHDHNRSPIRGKVKMKIPIDKRRHNTK